MLRVTKSKVRGAYKYYGLFYTGDRVISKEFIVKAAAKVIAGSAG